MSQRVAIERWGEGPGPTLLCLHGLGGSAAFFSGIGPALASRCRTVAFDFPGSGRSPADGPVDFDTLAAVVVEVARGLEAPLTLVGHSMGTIIGLEAIRRTPGLAGGFVSVGGVLQPRADACERIAARIGLIERAGMAGLGETVAAANVSARTRASRPDVVRLAADVFEQQPAQGYVATARALIGWKARPLPSLEGVSCLAITGAEDRYAPPDDVRAWATGMPGPARIEVVAGAAHLPFLEDPAEFSRILLRFLPNRRPA